MSRQDYMTLAFIVFFAIVAIVAINFLPQRDKDAWSSSTKKGVPPTADKTEQHHRGNAAIDDGKMARQDKNRVENETYRKPGGPVIGDPMPPVEAKGGVEGWLTPEELKQARGTTWEANAEGLQAALVTQKEELGTCFKQWKETLKAPPTYFELQITIETLYGEPYAAVRKVGLPQISAEKAAFERCLFQTLTGVTFEPPPGDSMIVNFPLNFGTPRAANSTTANAAPTKAKRQRRANQTNKAK